MTKIFLVLLVTIAVALAWASEFAPQVIERALPSNIATDIATISEDLQKLTEAVNAYQGGLLDYVAIAQPHRTLTQDLRSATTNAGQLDDLSDEDAQDILISIKELVPDIKGALDALTKKGPQFEEAGMSKRTATHLKNLQGVVKDYGDALLAHCPEKVLEQGKVVLAGIMDMFAKTIGHFQ